MKARKISRLKHRTGKSTDHASRCEPSTIIDTPATVVENIAKELVSPPRDNSAQISGGGNNSVVVPGQSFSRVEGNHIWHYVRKPFKLEKAPEPAPINLVAGVSQDYIDERTREWLAQAQLDNSNHCKVSTGHDWIDKLPQDISISDADIGANVATAAVAFDSSNGVNSNLSREDERRSRVWKKIALQLSQVY
jgi:hypothetical protein